MAICGGETNKNRCRCQDPLMEFSGSAHKSSKESTLHVDILYSLTIAGDSKQMNRINLC